MNIEKEARNDAREYARAEMFYGEGAGTRRKLIEATVQSKAARFPKYESVFLAEIERQDMAEHAKRARKERQRKDTVQAVSKNTKAIISGNPQNAQTAVMAAVVIGYFLHQTGLDRRMYEKSKVVYADVKSKLKRRKLKLVLVDLENQN